MSLVVFLRGLNVGGHRSFRPRKLADQLKHLDAINIGAAGTLVVRKPISRMKLRGEIARRLPFAAEIVICDGSAIRALLSKFEDVPSGSNVVRFVSVLSQRRRSAPSLPIILPSDGEWLLKVLAVDGPFIIGVYRRHMKVIGLLGSLDRIFGVRLTTRSWSTIASIGKLLSAPKSPRA